MPRSGIGNEMNPMPLCLRGLPFVNQIELIGFMGFQQRNHYIDTRPPQAIQLVLKPISSPWSARDGQTATPWTNYPEQIRGSWFSSIISRGS